MLIKPTQERLRAMRLSGMAEAFATQMEDTARPSSVLKSDSR